MGFHRTSEANADIDTAPASPVAHVQSHLGDIESGVRQLAGSKPEWFAPSRQQPQGVYEGTHRSAEDRGAEFERKVKEQTWITTKECNRRP